MDTTTEYKVKVMSKWLSGETIYEKSLIDDVFSIWGQCNIYVVKGEPPWSWGDTWYGAEEDMNELVVGGKKWWQEDQEIIHE